MSKKDVFNGMASGVSMLGLYFNAAAQELGEDKALQLYRKVGESFGAGNAQAWKQKFGDRTPSPKEIAEVLTSMYDGFGFEFSIKTDDNRVMNTIMKCPFYAGLAMAGLEHGTIYKMCQNASKGEEKSLKEAYPEIDVFAEPRKSPDGFCVEGYTFHKK